MWSLCNVQKPQSTVCDLCWGPYKRLHGAILHHSCKEEMIECSLKWCHSVQVAGEKWMKSWGKMFKRIKKKCLRCATEHLPDISPWEWAETLIKRVKITEESCKDIKKEMLIRGKQKKVMSWSCAAKNVPQLRVSLIWRIGFQDGFCSRTFGAECVADLTVLNPSGLYQGTDETWPQVVLTVE